MDCHHNHDSGDEPNHDPQFLNAKKQALSSVDRSIAGQIDEPIVELVKFINSNRNYYTTSSCSGRVIVSGTQKMASSTTIKEGRDWLFVSHGPEIENGEQFARTIVESALEKELDSATLKFEPLILHIRAQSIDSASQLVRLAVQSGLRESGMIISTKGRSTVAVRSNNRIEMPLIIQGRLIINQDQLIQLVPIINEKFRNNRDAIERFESTLVESFKE